MQRNIVIFCILLLAIATFFLLGLHRYLTFEVVKARHSEMVELYQRRPLPVVGAFMLLQITALALSLPGAVLTLALAGGAIFGPIWGTAIVLVSLTVGDSLGFLAARYVFRDWAQRRFGSYLARIEAGIAQSGALYLLSLRLMAVIPFFVINLSFGLTRMPLRTFAPASFVGLAPSTALYVNAGTELSRIAQPSDVYSPRLLVSFVLLALLPIGMRLLLRKRRMSR